MKKRKMFVITALLAVSILGQPNKFPKWERGFLDIHFISTGRGSAAFYLLPDGTSMIVDVGDLPNTDSLRRSTLIPDKSKTTAEWIADYIYQFHPKGEDTKLDYALITHYHADHFGYFDDGVKTYKAGNYKLSGITELGTILPISTLIDRGFDWPIDYKEVQVQKEMLKSNRGQRELNTLKEYWKFIEFRKNTNEMQHQKFEVGSDDQITLSKRPGDFPEFRVKNLFANGNICNTNGDSVTFRKYQKGEKADENCLCCGIRISYGDFNYYTGGDISGINFNGGTDNNSLESLVAPIIGPVDVATLNHHGNRDSQNEYFVRTIQPRVWIGQSWSANHPGEEVLRRITSKDIYPGERDLFTNFFHNANKTVIGRRAETSYKSTSGHIVIRVYPKGKNYDIFILNDKSEQRELLEVHQYTSRKFVPD